MPAFQSIQYLRAAAALAVVAFHVSARAGHPVALGAAGVDVFFVISGFIMWVVTARRPVRPGTFLGHRIVRIAPAYWMVTLLMVAAAAAQPWMFPRLQTPWQHVIPSLLFLPHRDPLGQIYPVLVPGWTLVYEMFFYGIFAASLLLPLAWRAACVTVALVALVAGGLLLSPTGAAAQTYTDPILLEFAGGLWLGVLTSAGRLPAGRWGGVLLLAGVAAFAAQLRLPEAGDAMRVLAWGVPALGVVAGALSLEAAGLVPQSRAGLEIGAASYAIYLLHGLVISAAFQLLPGRPVLAAAAACVLAPVVGIAFTRLVERPLTALLRAPRRPGLDQAVTART